MATTCIMPLHIGRGRSVGKAIQSILDYVENAEKTDHGRLVSCYGCNSQIADAEFLFSKQQYKRLTGRKQKNDVIAYHFRQSFRPGEVMPEEANHIGVEFAERFLKGNNAFIVCTHIDRAHIHNHVIWNSITLDCTRKFRNFWGSTKAVRELSDLICLEHHLSIVENPQRRGKSYNKWLGDKAEPCHRDILRAAIDDALRKKPADFNALLELLRENGITVTRRGKSISLRAPGWKGAA
ncbi:MAG: relaxase/mobilization nuclease domain-containing protein, partial [Oscillospiraceae bacterium]|nr:relaxase/mobilization nuclease domain-containing protein [Oscillospiraceae bacterium]